MYVKKSRKDKSKCEKMKMESIMKVERKEEWGEMKKGENTESEIYEGLLLFYEI